MKFRILGKIKIKREERNFSKIIEAESEKIAIHKLYSFFGNVYRLPRNKIIIENIKKEG